MLVMISHPLPLAELLETGVAIMVATRDAELRTHVTRGWGGYLEAGTGHLALALTDYPGPDTGYVRSGPVRTTPSAGRQGTSAEATPTPTPTPTNALSAA
jgi:hypothetical protein